MSEIDWEPLVEAAREAREQAYAPYSKFAVGAALLTSGGHVHTGCNVENISYGLTICAERNALFAAVAAGSRDYAAIAIVADTDVPVTPCGACRQVLAEFGNLPVLSSTLSGEEVIMPLEVLLPRAKAGILDLPEG